MSSLSITVTPQQKFIEFLKRIFDEAMILRDRHQSFEKLFEDELIDPEESAN